MKAERYITEYANAKIKDAKENPLMQAVIKEKIISGVERAVRLRVKGLITVNETIKMILEA